MATRPACDADVVDGRRSSRASAVCFLNAPAMGRDGFDAGRDRQQRAGG